MNKHTAGPWIVVQNGKQIDIHHKAIGDREITITTNANEKDARLIAAAPDMLEALKTAQVRIFMLEGESDEYNKITRVLDRAEGKYRQVHHAD
jgi:hypothetical protein